MIKVAVLDDYQDVFKQIIDIQKYKKKYDFKVFNEPFLNENDTVVALEEFEALLIMRERTPITKSSDLKDVIDKITKQGDKNILLSVIDNNNRRRYVGIKLN